LVLAFNAGWLFDYFEAFYQLISLGIALGYGLDDRGSRVRCPSGAGNFSLHHGVQNGSGIHPDSYPMGVMGKASGA